MIRGVELSGAKKIHLHDLWHSHAAGQLESDDFSLSGDSCQELRQDYLALVVTVVDIINGAAYLFDKAPDGDNQHWKADLEVEQFRDALEIQGYHSRLCAHLLRT